MGNTFRHRPGHLHLPEVPRCRGARCRPWQQRLEFVREYETELFTMTELAAQYGISRKTGYKWLGAYEAEGALGLLRSFAPAAAQPARDGRRRWSTR